MNKVILIGRLAQDPEVRYTTSGKAVATFALAVRKGIKKENGDYDADFIRIVVWEKQAEVVGNNLQKGARVLIDGSITTRNYTAQDGTKKYTTEVVARTVIFLDAKEKTNSSGGGNSPRKNDYSEFGTPADPEEEIPF